MTLPRDWRFTPDHTGLDEGGAIGTGEETLADYACTVALTTPGGLPEDPGFGAGLATQIVGGVADPKSLGAQLRSYLLEDPRVAEVSLEGRTESGRLVLPVGITPAEGPYRLAGPLTPELIDEIVSDIEGDEEGG
jgi:hypothetical protein